MMNYDYPQKRQWRRWVWNRLAERVDQPRHATVIYLAAETALDLEYAQRAGFRESNLIAVERDAAAVQKLRASGRLAIHGDLLDVMMAWPTARPIDAVHADFCCGLEESLRARLVLASMLPHMRNATIAANLLRGRDRSSAAFRSAWSTLGKPKHRAEMLCEAALCEWVWITGERGERAAMVYRSLRDVACPASYSYRSVAGSQMFDTTVWRSPVYGNSGVAVDRVNAMIAKLVAEQWSAGLDKQRKRTAAVLAHHTRRRVSLAA